MEILKNKVTVPFDAENFILTVTCEWQMGSGWYAPDLHVITFDT
jgi:hypothetical protein